MVSALRNSLVICLLFVFFGCSEEAVSDKDFYLDGNEVTISGNSETQTITGTSYIKFNSKKEFNLRWTQIYNETPEEWHMYFCDNVACHFDLPDIVDLKSIDFNSSKKDRTMKLYVNPNNQGGSGVVKIELSDLGNPAVKDTVTYKIEIK